MGSVIFLRLQFTKQVPCSTRQRLKLAVESEIIPTFHMFTQLCCHLVIGRIFLTYTVTPLEPMNVRNVSVTEYFLLLNLPVNLWNAFSYCMWHIYLNRTQSLIFFSQTVGAWRCCSSKVGALTLTRSHQHFAHVYKGERQLNQQGRISWEAGGMSLTPTARSSRWITPQHISTSILLTNASTFTLPVWLCLHVDTKLWLVGVQFLTCARVIFLGRAPRVLWFLLISL